MQRITRLTLALSMVLALASPALINAQSMSSVEPFKVGTFEINGAPTVGIVLRDALIIDLATANTALEIDPMYAHVNAPVDMLELIGQYEYGLKYRLYDIVNSVVGNDLLSADYVHRVEDVVILPPIMYPSKIMNAAVNFYTHACEGCTEEELAARTRERRANRGCRTCSSSRPAAPSSAAAKTSSCRTAVTGSNGKSRWRSYSVARASTSLRVARTTTCSATWSPWIFPIVVGVHRAASAPVPTGSSVRAMTRLRPKGRGLFQRSSTAIRWSACTRVWSSTV